MFYSIPRTVYGIVSSYVLVISMKVLSFFVVLGRRPYDYIYFVDVSADADPPRSQSSNGKVYKFVYNKISLNELLALCAFSGEWCSAGIGPAFRFNKELGDRGG